MPWLILWFMSSLFFTPSSRLPHSSPVCLAVKLSSSFHFHSFYLSIFYPFFFSSHFFATWPLFYCYLFITVHPSVRLSAYHSSAPLNWSVCPCMYLYIPLTVPSASRPFQPHPPASLSQPNWIPTIISILSLCSSFFFNHSIPLIFHRS